ncbi:hypothetical protein NBRC10512v2_005752 [Rhodotorula toruloides]|uniref:RHTO0S09e01464g1_1 n=2 Tax=Rhodotorula toruloides TaxID=5286 RepID=A0A061B8L7_RHOTO|nr:uncharacterized protein RHTO_07866 [Rhodotorula toruloides NP11]EMS22995.1 hypothetical protein RHTO_07866 [Rhodotorula toruloides NP11]CDR44230.1 RHTO0S09e01464g1_1 [Rhodotorula toruloides]
MSHLDSEKGTGPPLPSKARPDAARVQHLSDKSRQTVQKLSVLVPDEYREFFDTCWGMPCGRVLDGRGFCCTDVDVGLEHPFIVRQDYEEGYQYLSEAAQAKKKKAFVWYGQPGIEPRSALLPRPSSRRLSPRRFLARPAALRSGLHQRGPFRHPARSLAQVRLPRLAYCPLGFTTERRHFASALREECLARLPRLLTEFDNLLILTSDLSLPGCSPLAVRLSSIKVEYSSANGIAERIVITPASSVYAGGTDVAAPARRMYDDVVLDDVKDEDEDRLLATLLEEMNLPGKKPSLEVVKSAVASLAHLPEATQQYWLKWSMKNRYYTPIEVFRFAGPSVRDPMNGITRLTGDPRVDYFGNEFVKAPVNALVDLYRLVSPKMNADPNAPKRIELRSEDQEHGFHSFFFEAPATKDFTQKKPSPYYFIPTALIRDLVVQSLALQEEDVQRTLLSTLRCEPTILGLLYEPSVINYIANTGIRLTLLDQSTFDIPPGLPLLHVSTNLAVPLDRAYVAKLPPNHATYDSIIVLPEFSAVVLVQVTVSKGHDVVAQGFDVLEEATEGRIRSDKMTRILAFVGPEPDAAHALAMSWEEKKYGVRKKGKRVAPVALDDWELASAGVTVEQLAGKFGEVLVETSPQLPQTGFES